MRDLADAVDGDGRRLVVGGVIARGGEAAIHEIPSRPDLLAKIYDAAPSAAKAEKLRILPTLGSPGLSKVAAWPSGLVFLRGSSVPAGLLMPRVRDRKDIHLLYGPKSRRSEFPRADWRFLVRVASNTARAFAAVHSVGCVIGDVNHGGVLVAQDATVSLIDCDSFQVVAGGRWFLCDVGVETFTPPELQGKSFGGVLRTPDHDAFGLAVMCFLILFMGKHPFSGRYGGPGDMPIGKAIEEHRFAYGAARAAALMEPPPGSLPLSYLGDDVAGAFEQAFSRTAPRDGRPDAKRWASCLERLERSAVRCGTQASHWYPGHLASCPWCAVERSTGVLLFPVVVAPDGSVNADVEALWREVETLPALGPVPVIETPSPPPSPEAIAFEMPRPPPPAERASMVPTIAAAVAVFFVVAVVTAPQGLVWIAFAAAIAAGVIVDKQKSATVERRNAATRAKGDEEKARLRSELDRLEGEVGSRSRALEALLVRWRREASAEDFESRRSALAALRNSLADLPERRRRALAELGRNLRQSQMEAFLDRIDIASASIDGVGAGRKQTLASYGIETARDVDPTRLGAVPRFGPKTVQTMMAWRRSLEARFVFDARRPVDPRLIVVLEQAVISERARLQAEAKLAHAAARQAHAAVQANRRVQRPAIEAAAAAVARSRADLRHLGR